MSYLVGFGTKYPQKAHHRGSSIPSIFFLHDKVDCVQGFESWYKRSEPNPNVLYGALIGGPDSSDSFTDDRDNYEQNEPTTTAAAPLIGLFSRMLSAFSSATTSGSFFLHSLGATSVQFYSTICIKCILSVNCSLFGSLNRLQYIQSTSNE